MTRDAQLKAQLAEALAAKELAEAKLDEAIADNRRLLDSAERWCSLHNEALAAKERAEAERDAFAVGLADAKAALEWFKKDRPQSQLEAIATIAELTSALAAARVALKECADELASWVEGHYQLMLNYPSEARRFERDMGPVRRARALLAHPTTQPAKAEEGDA